MIADWLSFWDRPHSIYVSARHRDVHYRLIAQELADLVPSSQARVLDYGSGEALHADLLAAAAGELLLCDGAPSVRAALAVRFAGDTKIRILSPADVERLPDGCVDFIVLHSVAQYLAPDQMKMLLVLFRRLLKPNGVLLVSDIIPPQVGAAADVAALLRFSAGNGFFFAALAGLARTLFSDYRRLRQNVGLTHYGEAAMIEKLDVAGFAGQRAARNIGHNQARMAFVARPR
ncbi:MAG TPA: class I SAM-dependent methyltransferase [Xanthobacteraceae bacterium]|nr:class I SAM-dependent methyltransferase [Xanthobacteraceae bacterium]